MLRRKSKAELLAVPEAADEAMEILRLDDNVEVRLRFAELDRHFLEDALDDRLQLAVGHLAADRVREG